jgi:hypothetical protein
MRRAQESRSRLLVRWRCAAVPMQHGARVRSSRPRLQTCATSGPPYPSPSHVAMVAPFRLGHCDRFRRGNASHGPTCHAHLRPEQLRRCPVGRGGDVVAAKARTSGGNEALTDEFVADRVMRSRHATGRSAPVGMARPWKRATATGTAAQRSRVFEEGRASFRPCAMPRRARAQDSSILLRGGRQCLDGGSV